MIKDIDIDEKSFKKIEAIILSMTPEERAHPEILNGSRRKRIALGSGNSIQEVNQFIRQFEEMKKMMKTFTKMSAAGRGLKGLLPFGRF
jgi:signal recognition particle subunit SRP54